MAGDGHLKYDPQNGHLVFRDGVGADDGHLVTECAGTFDDCGCDSGDTNPRTLVTLSWTEDDWQASTTYLGHEIITVTVATIEYLFIKQNDPSSVSGGTEPTWDLTIGNTTTDNTVTWERIIDDYEREYLTCGFTNGQTREVCPTFYRNRVYELSSSSSTTYNDESWTNSQYGEKLRMRWVNIASSYGAVVARRSLTAIQYSSNVTLSMYRFLHYNTTLMPPLLSDTKSITDGSLDTHIPTSVLQLGNPKTGNAFIDNTQEGQITTNAGLTIAWEMQPTTTTGRKKWRESGGGTF